MAGLKILAFGARTPALDVRASPPGTAQLADTCRLISRAIEPWRERATVGTCPAGANTISVHQYDPATLSAWMTWTTDVNVQAAPVAGDTTARAYVTGLGAPRAFDNTQVTVTDGFAVLNSSWLLGVPAPLLAPTTVLGAGGAGTAVARTYVYTYVTAWGEEGPPSPPSTVLPTVLPGQLVTLSAFSAVPAGDYQISHRRIYRSSTGATTSAYELLYDLPVATPTYADTALDSALGAVLASEEWDPPPTAMVGITALPNNVMVGFTSNYVCFSEPGHPHAWPVRYRKTIPTNVVAVSSYGTTVVVGTDANPYLIICNTPSTASLIPLAAPQACASKRSMVRTEAGVVYASPDGLVHLSPQGYDLLTEGVMTRDQWQAYSPTTMSIHVHDGRFFIFAQTGSTGGVYTGVGFLIDPRQGGGMTTLSFFAGGGAVDALTDTLYLSIYSATSATAILEEWEGAATYGVATWQSVEIPGEHPVNMGVARVIFSEMTAEEQAEVDAAYAILLAEYLASGQSDNFAASSYASADFADYEYAGGSDITTSPELPAEAQVVFSLYGDGVLRATRTVTTRFPFTLDDGYTALDWSVKLSSNRVVRAVYVAPTMTDLKNL